MKYGNPRGLFVLLSVLSGLALLAVACAQPPTRTGAPAAGTEAPAATQEAGHKEGEATGHEAAEGKAIYTKIGCAGCHGASAEGTEMAPALPGHTAEQVRRQVRDPMGKMPGYAKAQLSDVDLDKVIGYIESLGPAAEGGHAGGHAFEMAAREAAHHQMAVLAVEHNNIPDAKHHIRHVIDLVPGAHKEQMEKVLALLDQGKTHDAQHEMEKMLLGAEGVEGKTMGKLHLELASTALNERQVENAKHHIQHFLEGATGKDKVKGQEILELLGKQDFHEAGHGIEELMGMSPHGG